MFSSDRVVLKLTKAVQESVAWKKELIKQAKPMKSAKIGSISFFLGRKTYIQLHRQRFGSSLLANCSF